MDFSEVEASENEGAVFEAYVFTYGPGDGQVYRYVNLDQDIEIDGDKFTAEAISREGIKSNGKLDEGQMNIQIPTSAEASRLFTAWPPANVVTVHIFAGHVGSDRVQAIWVGRVLSVARDHAKNTLTCDNTLISMKRLGLRRNWQFGCPHVLYGKRCRANIDIASFETTVTSTEGGKVELDADWFGRRNPEDFLGGMIKWEGTTGTEYRSIRAATQKGVSYLGPIRDLEEGATVYMLLGCNRTMENCDRLHNNILNYGGQPWIPLKNPVKYHPYW